MRPYLHHPPFISLYLAAVFAATGQDTPRVARTAVAALHVVAFLVFLRMAAMFFGNDFWPRLWAAFVFAVVPMSAFFGKMPNHEVPGLLTLELGVLASLCVGSRHGPRRGMLIPLFLSWFLVPLTSWHATLSAIVFIFCYGTMMRCDGRMAFLVVACSGLLTSLVLVLLQLLWANHWQSLSSQHVALSHWLAAPEGKRYVAFWMESILQGARQGRRFYGDIPWILSVAWVVWLGVRAVRRKQLEALEYSVLFLGVGSLLYCAVFARAIRIHAYQQFYFIPFVALSSAIVVSRLHGRLRRVGEAWAVLFVVALGIATLAYSVTRLQRLYREPGAYAVKASRDIEQQFY